MQRKEIDTNSISWSRYNFLKTVNKTLNSENKRFKYCYWRVLINAEEHSTMNNRYSTGYFQKINDENNILEVSFSNNEFWCKTIYEKISFWWL